VPECQCGSSHRAQMNDCHLNFATEPSLSSVREKPRYLPRPVRACSTPVLHSVPARTIYIIIWPLAAQIPYLTTSETAQVQVLSNHMYVCKMCMHMCQKDTLYGGGTLGPRRAAAPQAGLCVAVRSARAQLRGRPAIHCRATDPATGGPLESPAQTNKCLHRLNVR
jgi:hypothetical protein